MLESMSLTRALKYQQSNCALLFYKSMIRGVDIADILVVTSLPLSLALLCDLSGIYNLLTICHEYLILC